MRSITIVALSFVVLLASAHTMAANDKAVGKRATNFVLQDQFESKWTWSKHWRGKPTVLVMSDWKGSDYTANWTKPLVERFGGRVSFVALADVSLAPSFLRGFLRDKFKETFTNSILLDWDGDVFRYYNAQPSIPNILFIDSEGVVRIHTWGKGTGEHIQSFVTEVQKLLPSE